MTRLLTRITFLLAIAFSANSFSITTSINRHKGSSTILNAQQSSNKQYDRASFLQQSFLLGAASLATAFTTSPQPAYAKDDSSLKGTKKDPQYEACLSKCMYDCTKPKGDEQKSRMECLPECKQKCATTKAQLMKGTPKN